MPARVSDFYRTALVTGASTGLGRAFAEMLLAEGVRVWGTSRDPARLAPITGLEPLALDLRDGPAALEIFHRAERAAGDFDVVINNAGFGVFAEFAGADFSVWEEQLAVMLLNPARLAHAALPGMLARNRGALVNISSLAAEFPLPFQSAYNIAKAGLSAFSESLITETAGTGVVVLDVRPGDYRTAIDTSVRHPQRPPTPRMRRAWAAFEKMMTQGHAPAHAAASLRRALLRRRSGTVRMGRFSQAVAAPLLARLGSLPLRRRVQARYFDAG
ncbi:MAG: SDR family NAD(P)-dependent oxidoreductase [Opitutaceae bacterium]|nr:SDR family NAD(P)-dependent oxidoreductase [Opitutaceae bacterium]